MSKKTLGQLTKQILSDADMDVVNNINETEEALQVARVIRSVYEELVVRFNLPVEKELFQLEATNDTTPTFMVIPQRITKVDRISYDLRERFDGPLAYTEIQYLDPDSFLDLCNGRNQEDSTVQSIPMGSGLTLLVRNDRHPTYWTSFDNKTIVFDSYKSELDDNLRKSKTQCYGVTEYQIPLEEDAEIKLDPQLFSLLENKARATVFLRFKQSRDPSSEDNTRRLEINAQKTKWRQDGKQSYPGYGRWV